MKNQSSILIILFLFIFGCSSDKDKEPFINLSGQTDKIIKEGLSLSSGKHTFIIEFETNQDWQILNNEKDWCVLSNYSGTGGNHSITVEIKENESVDNRTAKLTLSNTFQSYSINIIQEQKSIIKTNDLDYKIGADGGVINIKYESNIDTYLEIPETYKSWISTNETRVLKPYTSSIIISPNYNELREGYIKIVSDKEISQEIKIIQEAYIPLQSIHFDFGEKLDLFQDGEYQLIPIFTPTNATNKDVKWSMSDNSIADIDENGLLNIKKSGEFEVYILNTENNISTKLSVYVKIPIKSINIKTSFEYNNYAYSVCANPNSTTQLYIELYPENAHLGSYYFTSSNEEVATVKEDKLICFNKEGESTIALHTESGIINSLTLSVQDAFVHCVRSKYSHNEKTISFKAQIFSNNPEDVININNITINDKKTGYVVDFITMFNNNNSNIVTFESNDIDVTKYFDHTEYGSIPNFYFLISDTWELDITYSVNGKWNRKMGLIRSWIDYFNS